MFPHEIFFSLYERKSSSKGCRIISWWHDSGMKCGPIMSHSLLTHWQTTFHICVSVRSVQRNWFRIPGRYYDVLRCERLFLPIDQTVRHSSKSKNVPWIANRNVTETISPSSMYAKTVSLLLCCWSLHLNYFISLRWIGQSTIQLITLNNDL